MITTGTLWLMFFAGLVAAGVGLAVVYAVIQAAVLAALRQHTVNSVAAVSIVSAVPITVREEAEREG